MKLSSSSSLTDVVMHIGEALDSAGIHAVLTGGACASFYTAGDHVSNDADFILRGMVTRDSLDQAMAGAGFARVRDHYRHPRVRFIVEFPRGPLAIGRDHGLKPRQASGAQGRVRLLSATDSCRDRLAQFYFWKDGQGLRIAVEIACRQRVNLAAVRKWSVAEGCEAEFDQFRLALQTAKRSQLRRS